MVAIVASNQVVGSSTKRASVLDAKGAPKGCTLRMQDVPSRSASVQAVRIYYN